MKVSRKISYSAMLEILSIMSSSLMMLGSRMGVQIYILTGLLLSVAVCLVVLFLINRIKYSELIFVTIMVSLSISLSYELLSPYPLGQDVHAEYYVVKETLRYGKFDPLRQGNYYVPQYYYEIFGFITLSVITSNVTGLTEIETIKFVWGGLILGLIPIATLIYSRKTVNSKIAIFISGFLVMVQSSFVTTLHSTTKQSLGLFVMIILTTFLLGHLGDERITRLATLSLILLILGLGAYHYLVSGVYLLMIILALFILMITCVISRDRPRILSTFFKCAYLTMVLFISWFLNYTLLSGGIVEPMVNIIEDILLTRRRTYAYDYVYVILPTHLNYLRLVINGIIITTVLLAGMNSLHKLLRKLGDFTDSLIVSASFLFLILSISEILGYSTIGIGRLSMIFIVIVSPYFYPAFKVVISKIRIKKEILVDILLALILVTRMLLSIGVLPYAVGDIENSVFLDPTYKFEVSLAYPDLTLASFINLYDSYKMFCADVKATNIFYYVGDLESMLVIHNYYTNVNCITYFSSFNIIRNKAILRVGKPSSLTSFFEIYTLSRTKIFDSGYALAFI